MEVIESLLKIGNCTGDVVNTLIPFIQEGGLNSIDVLSINGMSYLIVLYKDNATLVETAVFSSQVAEQGVISSIRQLILPCILFLLLLLF